MYKLDEGMVLAKLDKLGLIKTFLLSLNLYNKLNNKN